MLSVQSCSEYRLLRVANVALALCVVGCAHATAVGGAVHGDRNRNGERAGVGGDREADGILDRADRCPDDPEDRDEFEDDDGCPEPDNDQDRLPDARDDCPLNPETYNGCNDWDGCPDRSSCALFSGAESGSWHIHHVVHGEDRDWSDLVDAASHYVHIQFTVQGHCLGRNAQAESVRAADATAEKIVAAGGDGNRVQSEGRGAQCAAEMRALLPPRTTGCWVTVVAHRQDETPGLECPRDDVHL